MDLMPCSDASASWNQNSPRNQLVLVVQWSDFPMDFVAVAVALKEFRPFEQQLCSRLASWNINSVWSQAI